MTKPKAKTAGGAPFIKVVDLNAALEIVRQNNAASNPNAREASDIDARLFALERALLLLAASMPRHPF